MQLGYAEQFVKTIYVQFRPQLVLVQPVVQTPVLLQSGQALLVVKVAFQLNLVHDEFPTQLGYEVQFVQV